MQRYFLAFGLVALAGACSVTPEGIRRSQPPAAVQGSNDAQGSPLSVPGAGMGVGSGSPKGAGTSGAGGMSGR